MVWTSPVAPAPRSSFSTVTVRTHICLARRRRLGARAEFPTGGHDRIFGLRDDHSGFWKILGALRPLRRRVARW
jgi:hypothetical protein